MNKDEAADLGLITDAGLAAMEAEKGVYMDRAAWNSTVSEDGIRHFALGIGDDNPLWWDADYAATSVHRDIIAPPCYLYSHFSGPILRPGDGYITVDRFLPGVMGLWDTEKWVWHRPVRVGERISARSALASFDVSEQSSFGGRAVRQTERLELATAAGEIVAENYMTIRRFERGGVTAKAKYLDRPLQVHDQDSRARIAEQYDRELQESRRGATPRFVSSLAVGDPVGPMLKGPFSLTNLISFRMGTGSSLSAANRMHHAQLAMLPGVVILNPVSGVAEHLEAPHWDAAMHQLSGLPTAYDFGSQRFSWFSHLVSDWMGDDGFLCEMEMRLRRPNLAGDLTWLRGSVSAIDPETGMVRLTLESRNQLDDVTATATATVRLPIAG